MLVLYKDPEDRLEIVNLWGKGFVYDLTGMIDPMYIVKGGKEDLKVSFAKIEKRLTEEEK